MRCDDARRRGRQRYPRAAPDRGDLAVLRGRSSRPRGRGPSPQPRRRRSPVGFDVGHVVHLRGYQVGQRVAETKSTPRSTKRCTGLWRSWSRADQDLADAAPGEVGILLLSRQRELLRDDAGVEDVPGVVLAGAQCVPGCRGCRSPDTAAAADVYRWRPAIATTARAGCGCRAWARSGRNW